jgi:hypothetical protein
VDELDFSPNFNPWRYDRDLSQLREKLDARKKLMHFQARTPNVEDTPEIKTEKR